MGEIMSQSVSYFEEAIMQFRHISPTNAATAQASAQHEPWERIAMNAIDDGYFKSADEFVRFVDACLRHLVFEQVVYGRAYAIAVRNLADAIARLFADENSRKCTPTADEIAEFLQSEWVTLGHFRSLRSAVN